MGTRRKLPKSSGLHPYEVDVFDGMEALGCQDSHHLGLCDLEIAENLEKIAALFDPPDHRPETPRLKFSAKPTPLEQNQGSHGEAEFEDAWESTSAQLQAAIDARVPEAIGCYLRDVAQLHRRSTRVLAPPAQFRGPRLEFVQRGRGRRPDPKNTGKDADIAIELSEKTLEYGKQEAAIQAIMSATGKSRATVLRAKSRFQSLSRKKR